MVFLGVIGLAVAAAILLPRMLKASSNRNRPSVITTNPGNANFWPNANANADRNGNANQVANANENTNDSSTEPTNAPTDSAAVLAALTDLEHEWTVANINADKKALDRILGDDFVGITDGQPSQGKAQYIREIKRDTAIEKWDFEDLKVDLKGDRATLTGIVKFIVNGQDVKFKFVDKFVWRDGRWQATSSKVDPIK